MIIELSRHGHVGLFAKKRMLNFTVTFSKCQNTQGHLASVKMHIELFYLIDQVMDEGDTYNFNEFRHNSKRSYLKNYVFWEKKL